METLKDLFLSNASYIIELPLNKERHLFIEGLSENGCTNTDFEFDVDNIKNFCIELIDNDGEYMETVDNIGITLETTTEELKRRVG